MMPASSDYRPMSTETSVWYDAYAFENDSWDLLTLAQPTMQDAIENPASLILPSSIAVGYKYDWLYNSTSNLWSYSSEGLKTIYDPCPYGYKVPDSEIQALPVNSISGTSTRAISNTGVSHTSHCSGERSSLQLVSGIRAVSVYSVSM